MQHYVQILLGWASIGAGIALAIHTLGFLRRQTGITHTLRAYRPAEWSGRQSARAHVRPMDPARQLQRLTAIAERGFAQVEGIANLHTRAAEELEAASDELARLLGEFKADALPPARPHEAVPTPVPAAEPLAA